jgi:predicted nucleic acid-binding Zn ribbon protein
MQYVKPKRLGELLPKLFRDPVIVAKIAEASLPEVWTKVAGDVAARYTTEVSFRRGVMTVCISSSVLRHELFMQRTQLRDRVNAASRAPIVRELIIK